MTILVKGQRVRTEMTAAAVQQVIIMDVPAGKIIVLKLAEKVAEVWDAAKFQGEMSARMSGPVSVTIGDTSVTPTGQKKSILGATCEERQISASMTFTLPAETAAMTIAGTIWTPVNGPGVRSSWRWRRRPGRPGSRSRSPARSARRDAGRLRRAATGQAVRRERRALVSGEFTMTFSGEGRWPE